MNIPQDNQKRHEIKFIINKKEKINFINKNHLNKIFPDRIVESIYFDTKDLQFFSLSEEGVTPRFKIRLRGYNNEKPSNLEIKKTKNYHREKIVLKNFQFNSFELHKTLKNMGINNIVDQKIRVKYLRSYYELKDLGRITMDENIEFFNPSKEFRNPKKINKIILEVKIQRKEIDKNHVEKIINLKESRFSKYCVGINCLRNSN
jgi:hypothetical protein|tara:strand:- start:219 stop:830 length:612 start_codon:yes stop_codon:yes gene_type:complete